jgi:hypothetical protein
MAPPIAPRLGALPALLLLACTGGDPDEAGDLGGDVAAGRYELTTNIDATGALPDGASEAIGLLEGLSDNPAGTIIALLEAADIPLASDLLNSVPAVLRGQVEKWINDFLFNQLFEGVPVTEQIADWTANLSILLTDFDLISKMDLSAPDGTGTSFADHQMAAVAFTWGDERLLVDTPDIVDTLTMATDVSCTLEANASGGAIDIDEHAFHMPLGDFAVVGFTMGLEQLVGFPNLGAALGAMIDCEGLADSVSSRCVINVCVGHRDELLAVCQAGLELVADTIEARIASIDFAELALAEGRATLTAGDKQDAAGRALFDGMKSGTWQAAVNVDGVAVPVAATFTGRRLDRDTRTD